MHEKLPPFVRSALEGTAPYPQYPTTRFVFDTETTPLTPIDIPDGPWQMNDTSPPSAEETAAFIAAGISVDSKGRPLHPAFLEMAKDPAVGVVTGKGRYWNWGPNYTADPIVITDTADPRVLLIRRGDTGAWALPGGFIDPHETDAATAARRELKEETSLVLDDTPTEVYVGLVGDARTTAHAWPETSAYLYRVPTQQPVQGQDDAQDARWIRLRDLGDSLFGSHKFLVEQALRYLPEPTTPSLQETLTKPFEELPVEYVSAGHMAYDHMFVSDAASMLFVKRHLAERFNDPVRETHSRLYLQKEAAFYEYLAQRGFTALPHQVALIEDSLLAMDAFPSRDGWQWRAPRDDTLFARYTADILNALTTLQRIAPPADTECSFPITPSYETFWREGWDAITPTSLQAITQKALSLSEHWNAPQQQALAELLANAPELLTVSSNLSRTPPLYMAHNDARQSNIAWHENEGVRMVDWSWADPAPEHADTTMFLVDLAKSGHDVTPYMYSINKEYLVTLIGFWLAHSIWETRDGSTTVREQQVASAVAAYQLLTLPSLT